MKVRNDADHRESDLSRVLVGLLIKRLRSGRMAAWRLVVGCCGLILLLPLGSWQDVLYLATKKHVWTTMGDFSFSDHLPFTLKQTGAEALFVVVAGVSFLSLHGRPREDE